MEAKDQHLVKAMIMINTQIIGILFGETKNVGL
jgi:hypothetical protein